MIQFNQIGKILIIFGIILVIFGSLMVFSGRIGIPLGRLPGDLLIKKKNVIVYFPLVTSLVLSILISLILFLISKFK